ncbi:MAG: shikimate kinase [bacterium]|nr:shikimate kinase [bacterium]
MPSPSISLPVTLVGLRCSGKTTVGRALAARLGTSFRDLDEALVDLARTDREPRPSAGDLLAELGVGRFRDLEQRALEGLLAGTVPGVIATGGGCVEREANRLLLAGRTCCVWLRAPVEVLGARLAADSTSRPALDGGSDPVAEIAAIARRREDLYRTVAHVDIDTGSLAPAEVLELVITALSRR